jgi:integrase
MIPKLRRNGDGRAFAIYPETGGKRAYFGKFGTPEAESAYQAWLADLLKAKATGEPIGKRRSGVSVIELIDTYLEWSDANHSAGESRNNWDTLDRLLSPKFGDMRADEFGPNALRRFQQHLAAQTVNDSPRFARTTVNNHVKRVRRFFRWCQSRELLPPGFVQELETVEPLKRGRTPARETAPVQPVPRWVWERTLDWLDKKAHQPVRTMIQVQFWCGMRPIEVCSMRPCDIDRTHEVWLYRPVEHKTAHWGKTLIKAIPPPAQTLLEPLLDGPADRPLFMTIRNRQHTALTYGKAIRTAVRDANEKGVRIPHWSPNQLRHAILTEIRDRLGLKEAQRWAGHSDSATTLIYAWTATAELREIAASLAEKPST